MEDAIARQVSLRRELLRVVLHDTLRKFGVPAPWIGGEATPAVDAQGRLSIEVRLIVECDEPRFLYYLAAFQAEFESRLLTIEPGAWDWVSRISWSLRTRGADSDPDYRMPPPEYWQHVLRDREVTARQHGGLQWDQEALGRHFEDTDRGAVDFEDTGPPERDVENIIPPRAPG